MNDERANALMTVTHICNMLQTYQTVSTIPQILPGHICKRGSWCLGITIKSTTSRTRIKLPKTLDTCPDLRAKKSQILDLSKEWRTLEQVARWSSRTFSEHNDVRDGQSCVTGYIWRLFPRAAGFGSSGSQSGIVVPCVWYLGSICVPSIMFNFP